MKDQLLEILRRFENKRIIVWGDLILDEYIYTSTSRISREAPVLVTEFERNEYKLGGAGNVVMNLNALGATPIPVGFIGTGSDGRTIKEILHKQNISTDQLVQSDQFTTPKKSRILSGGDHTKKQQVLRIDSINKTPLTEDHYRHIEENLKHLLSQPGNDYLLISDYIFQSVNPEVYERIKTHFSEKCIIIDSRQHFPDFKAVSIATPNEPEIKKMFPRKSFYSEQDFYDAGRELLEKLNARGIILKRGHKGMIVFEPGKEARGIEIYGSSDIVDVTGAGDTVISVLMVALSSGADLFTSAQLANIAAGFVVMKQGAYPIRIDELKHELEQMA